MLPNFSIVNPKVLSFFYVEILVERNLDKCPDKNAKLTLELSAYAKEEIKQDQISHKSN